MLISRLLPIASILRSLPDAYSYVPSPSSRRAPRTASTRLDKWRRSKASWKSGLGHGNPTSPSTLPHLDRGTTDYVAYDNSFVAEEFKTSDPADVLPMEDHATPPTAALNYYGGMPSSGGTMRASGSYGIGAGASRWKAPSPPPALSYGGMPAAGGTSAKAGAYGIGSGASRWKADSVAVPFENTPPADVLPEVSTHTLNYGGMPEGAPMKAGAYGLGTGSSRWKAGFAPVPFEAMSPADVAALNYGGMPASDGTPMKARAYGIGSGASRWKAGFAPVPFEATSPAEITPQEPFSTASLNYGGMPVPEAPSIKASAYGIGSGASRWKNPPPVSYGIGAGMSRWKS